MRAALSVLAGIAVALMMGVAGFALYHSVAGKGAGDSLTSLGSRGLGETMAGRHRPDFVLPDIEGRQRQGSEWDGKVLVVNFWATWCPPCREEIPGFVDLQSKYEGQGLQFLGIAIDEPASVKDFADKMRINYPILVGDANAIQVAKDFGNHIGALPYTVIVDRAGRIALTRPGELSRDEAEAAVHALL